MKILYSADNRFGAAHQLKDFINATSHEVKVAAYPKSGRLLPFIDWNLNAAKNNITQLQNDIKDYYPDLVLIDAEPIIADIAFKLDIPILYCSSLHLLDGLVWKRGQRIGSSATIEELRRKLKTLPPSFDTLIYSPFGDLSIHPEIQDGFEWIQPYHIFVDQSFTDHSISVIEDPVRNIEFIKLFQRCQERITIENIDSESYKLVLSSAKFFLMEGNTRQVADAIYNRKPIIFFPKIKDPENLLNAIIGSNLQIGINLDQVELSGLSSVDKIEKAVIEFIPNKINKIKEHKKLHERINELWECM